MFTLFARTRRALFLVLLALALLATACGSATDDVVTDVVDTASDMAASDDDTAMDDDAMATDDDDMDDDTGHDMDDLEHDDDASAHGDDDGHGSEGHGHAAGIEVAADLPTPSITVEAFEDPAGGWTVHAVPVNHRIAPENASTEHIDGEGHMHLFVDGERIGRIYNEWVPVPSLGEGTHDIRVELSANNHSALMLDGETIDATVSVTEAASEGHKHHGDHDVVEAAAGQDPSVTLAVFEDPKSGWNVHAVAMNHEMAPLAVSTEPADGEGHMHLYVDGKKVTRMYGEWVHLGTLTDGDHEIRVELSANNHKPLAVDGKLVEATVTITQVDGIAPLALADGDGEHGDSEQGDGEHGSSADNLLMITVAGDEVSGDSGRVEIEVGSTVEIVVDGDVPEEVHVHGYDILGEVTADENAVLSFTADIPGLFEVELEGSGVLLAELEVR